MMELKIDRIELMFLETTHKLELQAVLIALGMGPFQCTISSFETLFLINFE